MRRKSLIDKKFQLKTTFRIIGIIIIAFIFIIGITGIVSTDNNRKINAAISDLNRSIEKETKIVEVLLDPARNAGGSKQARKDEGLIDDHLETMSLMRTSIQHLQKTTARSIILITSMIVTGVLLGIILFMYLIRLTGRISGPIFVLTKHIRDVLAGAPPDLRGLRKDDEFKEFYSQFVEFIKKSK